MKEVLRPASQTRKNVSMKWLRVLTFPILAVAVTASVAQAQTRAEETASTATNYNGTASISYTGNWNQGSTVRAFSGATAAYSNASAARATLTFRGTGVRWISAQGPQTGIANVYVDGVSVATVDTYSPTEQMQVPLFTSSALAAGIHTVTIEVTGNKNPASTDALVVVDAFDVTP